MDRLHADFLRHFDGLSARTVFIPWLDQGSMTVEELQSLWATLNLCGCPLVVINTHTVGHWVHPEHPLPQAFDRLDKHQRAGYMTCYLMHWYGGGFASLASPRGQWMAAFNRLENGVSLALRSDGSRGDNRLLSVRRNTPLTRRLIDEAGAMLSAHSSEPTQAHTGGELRSGGFANALDRVFDQFLNDVISDFKES